MKVSKRILLCTIVISIFIIQQTYIFGEPIVDPERSCSITITKYAVENIEDYTEPAIGEEQTISDLQPLENIGFTITRVQDTDTDPATATPLTGESEFTHVLYTDEAGIAIFSDLAQGVYLVHENRSTAVAFPVADFLVNLPMTNASGTNWIYDIYIYPKNQLEQPPTNNMYISNKGNRVTPLHVGQTCSWFSTTQIPRDMAESKQYELVVTLNDNLICTTDPSVYLEYKDGETVTLNQNTDYTMTREANNITIGLTNDGRIRVSELLDDSLNPYVYVKIDTVLDATDIESILSTKLSNQLTFNYVNSIDIPHSATLAPENNAYVYTGGFVINKVDNRNSEPLSGATFKLYPTLNDATAGTNAIITPNGTEEWTVTSTADGRAEFYGIAYGTNGEEMEEAQSEYYLVETVAPTGYNLLTSPVPVTVDHQSHLTGNETIISNRSGFTLPITGGMGTLIFSIVGIGLIVTAIYLYRRSRNRNTL